MGKSKEINAFTFLNKQLRIIHAKDKDLFQSVAKLLHNIAILATDNIGEAQFYIEPLDSMTDNVKDMINIINNWDDADDDDDDDIFEDDDILRI